MTFVTASYYKAQLERLTQQLISLYPGSTVYQHTELCRVSHDVLSHKVDAVFLETDQANGLDFVQMLRKQKANLPVFIISQTEDLRKEAAAAGVNGYFVQPVTEQQLREAMRSAMNKDCVAVSNF